MSTHNHLLPPRKIHSNHIDWIDALRFLAIFMVVMSHAADSFNFGSGVNPDVKWWGAFWGSALRPCVPLFVMMTGLLLFPIKTEMSTFYKKRIPRVLFPFLIWSVIYNLFPWFVGVLGGTNQMVNKIFPYASDITLSFSSAAEMCMKIPLNYSQYAVHMWYVYLLIGLYLFMPIFSAWIERATKREKEFVLLLWSITLFLPYLSQLFGIELWAQCVWNHFPMLYYFAGFTGYLLLGHYLATYNVFSWRKTLSWAIPLYFIGFYVTFTGFRYMCSNENATDIEMELFFTFNSFNVMMQTFALFIVMQKVRVNIKWMKWLFTDMAKYGFGIYLIHYFVVGFFYTIMLPLPLHTGLRLPIVALVAFFATYLFTKLLGYIPKSKYLIG